MNLQTIASVLRLDFWKPHYFIVCHSNEIFFLLYIEFLFSMHQVSIFLNNARKNSARYYANKDETGSSIF